MKEEKKEKIERRRGREKLKEKKREGRMRGVGELGG